MPQSPYLSTDPNAGQGANGPYLSRDPNAGLAPMASHEPQKPPEKSWTDFFVDLLPTAGGAAGGIVGGIGGTVGGFGVGGVPGAVGGAALGGAAGEAYKELINRARGKGGPATPLQATGQIVKQAGIQGGSEAAGIGLVKAGAAVAPRIMQSALKPSKALLEEYRTTAPKLVQTMFDEGINVTRGGLEKLQRLFGETNQEIGKVVAERDALRARMGFEPPIQANAVAARALPVAKTFSNRSNATKDLTKIGETVEDFLNHPTYQGRNMTLHEAQRMKTGTYKSIGEQYGELSSAETETRKAFARGLKEDIAAEAPDISKLNARDSELMAALDAVGHRVALAGNKDPIGFAWVTHNPMTFMAALFDRSPVVKSMVARGLYQDAAKVAKVPQQFIRAAVAAIAAGEDESIQPIASH